MLDPSIWTDEGFATLTPRQQVLYIGLISNADDDGRLKGSSAAVRLMLPAVFNAVRMRDVEDDLRAVLARMTKLVRYTVDGVIYLCFLNYRDWQNINRPTASRLPTPPESFPDGEPDMSAHGSLTDISVSTHTQVKGIEEKGIEEKTHSARGKPAPVCPDAFDAFWRGYPRKERKPAAIAAWNKLRPPPDECDAIMAGLTRWQASAQWARGIYPHPATWLNGRQWEDEPEPAHKENGSTNGTLSANREDIERARLRRSEERGRVLGALRQEITGTARHDPRPHPLP